MVLNLQLRVWTVSDTELITQPHPPIKVSPFHVPTGRVPEIFDESTDVSI